MWPCFCMAQPQEELERPRSGKVSESQLFRRHRNFSAFIGRCRNKNTVWHCKIFIPRSEEPTSQLQSLMRISSAVFCLKNKTTNAYYHLPLHSRSSSCLDSFPYLHKSHILHTAVPRGYF